MPAFSIITVTHNNLGGLKRTYESLCIQSDEDYEWLVIDGASTDGTAQFLTSLDAERLSWSSEPDDGIYDAMNKGIKRAKGDYLLFLNAGDTLYNSSVLEKLSSMIKAQSPAPDFIYGDSTEEDESGMQFYKKARAHTAIQSRMFTHHQSMIYRRKTLGTLQYDQSYKIAADYKLTARFLKQSEHMLYCPFPLCSFEPGGISQTQAARGRREQFRIRREEKLCGQFRNTLIYLIQTVLMGFRRVAPNLYWALHSGSRPVPPA